MRYDETLRVNGVADLLKCLKVLSHWWDAALYITITIDSRNRYLDTTSVANSFAKAIAATTWHSDSILSKGTGVWWYNV